MIKLNNVYKSLGKFNLKDISFELPKGYIMGLIGTNGSGKTTLLHLIMGLYKEDSGDIEVDGMRYPKEETCIHDKIGTVLQDKLFRDSSTLLENAEYYGRFYSQYNRDRLCEYLTRFNLDVNKKHKELSKGEKLKFQFAFALSHNPEFLLLDEPTANFDIEFREEFITILKEFVADEKHSVILSTHLTDELDRIADYILYIHNGEQVAFSDIETLRNSYRLVTGETYKIKLIPKEKIVGMQENPYGTKALVKHRKYSKYDSSLDVAKPTLEELMYYMTQELAN